MSKYKITEIEHPKYPWLHRIQALIDVNEKVDRKSTRLNSSHPSRSRMPSSA